MAITTFGLLFYPNQFYGTGQPAFTALTMNASGDRVGFVIQIPKTGTLDWFEFRVGAVSNNPDNGLRLSFQDISLTTGFPDGTQDQFVDVAGPFTANTWVTPAGVMTNDGTAGGIKRSVTRGQLLGCVVDFVTFVAGDAIEITPLTRADEIQNFYTANGTTGSYLMNTGIPIIALKYNDGTYAEFPIHVSPFLAFNTRTFNNASTPDERALRFQVPIACRINGIWARINISGNGDIILYDNADNVLASVSFDLDVTPVSTGDQAVFYFDTSVSLSANTTYRIAIKPTSATNVSIYDFDINSAALMAAVNGGNQLYSSTRTDAGVWTDTTTNRPFIGLMLDGFETGGGGGAGGSYVF